MTFNILFALVIVGWIVKKIWETHFSKRTGRPPEDLWRNPTPADIRRRRVELENKIERIEKLVGLDSDPAAAESILDGLVDWEDYVESGFEREKEQWLLLNRQLSSITPKPSVTIGDRPPCPAVPGSEHSIFQREKGQIAEVERLKRDHPFKYFLVRGGMPGFARVRRDLAERINPGLRKP